jgi:hypothetical protein
MSLENFDRSGQQEIEVFSRFYQGLRILIVIHYLFETPAGSRKINGDATIVEGFQRRGWYLEVSLNFRKHNGI